MFLQQQTPLNISAQLDYNYFSVLSPGDTDISITKLSAIRSQNRKDFFSKIWHDCMYFLKLLRVRYFKSAAVCIYFRKVLNHKNIAHKIVLKMYTHTLGFFVWVCLVFLGMCT